MEKEKISHIFGKELTEHLSNTETNKRYLEARLCRFRDDFLDQEQIEFNHIESVMEAIHEYLSHCMEARELDYCLLNLKQSIYWLSEYRDGEYE